MTARQGGRQEPPTRLFGDRGSGFAVVADAVRNACPRCRLLDGRPHLTFHAMEILLSRPRETKLSPGLVLVAATFCVPAALAWLGAGLYLAGLWGKGADVAAAIPLWGHLVVASLPLVGGALAAILYVRQLRNGRGDWRLLAVVAVAAALTVGSAVAAFTILEPGSAPAARAGGGGAAPAPAGGRSGGSKRPSGGSRPSSGGAAPRR